MLGVPNNGAFGPPPPQPKQLGTAALRPARPPTAAPMGQTRLPAGYNQQLGQMRADRPGGMGRPPAWANAWGLRRQQAHPPNVIGSLPGKSPAPPMLPTQPGLPPIKQPFPGGINPGGMYSRLPDSAGYKTGSEMGIEPWLMPNLQDFILPRPRATNDTVPSQSRYADMVPSQMLASSGTLRRRYAAAPNDAARQRLMLGYNRWLTAGRPGMTQWTAMLRG